MSFLPLCSASALPAIEKISLPCIEDLQRADIYGLKFFDDPKAVLVLCPGFDGNGRDWLESPAWQAFAREQHVNLAALSFASDGEALLRGRGYYYAAKGSGKLLLEGLSRLFPGESPLLLYGFSGGAQFASRFAEWCPERVLGWCAYSAGWWDEPRRHPVAAPAGLVMCGEDDARYGASLLYFEQGRALGDPWLWVGLAKTDHVIEPAEENFGRRYLASLLEPPGAKKGGWVDVDFDGLASKSLVEDQPSLTGWLPDLNLLPEWRAVNHPQ